MTDLLRDVETPSDAELISRVRGGDIAAYGQLFSRHKDAANRLARQLVRGSDSDDLVAEAFAKVLTVLRRGGGPDVAFRAYLLTAVRRLHIDRVRLGQRLQTTDDMTPFDPGVPFKDTAVAGFESGAAAKAFASLPERWQLVLWHLEVEGQKPADIAPLLGMSANSVSALAYRAREGLRQAFLTMHLSDTSDTDCRWVNEHLGAYIRKGLSKRDAAKVEGHLDGCRRCTAMHLELRDVNSNLAGIIAPLLLGSAAAGYLASSGAGAVGVVSLVSRTRDLVGANTGAAAAAGVAAAVAAAAVVAAVLNLGTGDRTPTVVADPPAGVTSSAAVDTGRSPSSRATPTSGVSTRPAPSPRSARTPTLSPSPPLPTGAFSLNPPLGPLVSPLVSSSVSPSAVPAVRPSGRPAPSASSRPTARSSPSPSPSQTQVPTPTASNAPGGIPTTTPGTPARVIGAPVLHPNGTVELAVQNVRAGDTVDVSIASRQTTFPISIGVSGCRTIDSNHAACVPTALPLLGRAALLAVPVTDYSVTLPLEFPDYMVSDDVEITARVSGAGGVDGVSASTGSVTFRPERSPVYDFPAPVLGSPVHTLVGDEDRYGVSTTAVLPPRVTGLAYTLTGPARFRDVDGGCTVQVDGTVQRCPGVVDGATVDLSVAATALTEAAEVGVSVSGVDRFDDPSTDVASLTLTPGVNLGLAALEPDNASPDNDDDVHAVNTALTGVRAGLGAVTFELTGEAALTGVNGKACRGAGTKELTCDDPSSGPVRLTVTTPVQPTRATTPIAITATSPAPFVELDRSDNSRSTSLAARPTYNFQMGPALDVTAHTVSEDIDRFTVRTKVHQLPEGMDGLTFRLAGGTFAEDQGAGCDVAEPASVTCVDLADGRDIDLKVESTSHIGHALELTLQVPTGYRDPSTANNGARVDVAPGVDLSLGPLTPANPVPTGGTYEVAGVVTGIRSGPVTFEVTGGAAVRSPGCAPAGHSAVTCTEVTNGEPVRFTLTPHRPATSTTVTVRARAADTFEELEEADNDATTSLAPDVTISSLTQRSDGLLFAGVRAHVTGVPAAVSTLRLRLSGTGTGLTPGQVHFTSGASGGDGEGDVDCYTSDGAGEARQTGLYVTCTRVARATSGSFYVDTRLAHPHPSGRSVTFTVVPVGVDEGAHGTNNSRDITVH